MELEDYHNSIVGTKEELQIYRLMLIKILRTYEEKDEEAKCKELIR